MTTSTLDGDAVIYCEGAFSPDANDHSGKTAHGLIRFTRRYAIRAVIDSTAAGNDAGEVLDGRHRGIPIVASLPEAVPHMRPAAKRFFVIGLAPHGGRLGPAHRTAVKEAIRAGFNVDSGIHEYLTDNADFVRLARMNNVALRDIRKCPPIDALHPFTGKTAEVTAFRVAVLGTDSAVGKRTTAWRIVQAYEAAGKAAELIGTGQTAWLQGANYAVRMDGLINDFVAGELEHATWSAWKEKRPDVLVIEGQGSLMNPGYPGGYEILAACRPDAIVLQHAPARTHYEDFPGYPIHSLAKQIQAHELISGKRVIAVTVNREGLSARALGQAMERIRVETNLPVIDPLTEPGLRELFSTVEAHRPHIALAAAAAG